MEKGVCRHYDGMRMIFDGKPCAAGVDVKALTGGGLGWVKRTPCLKSHACNNPVSCGLYSDPTDQEVADYDEARRISTEGVLSLIPVMSKLKAEHDGSGTEGVIKCPVCPGDIHYTIAASNGHMRGRCETENCITWME